MGVWLLGRRHSLVVVRVRCQHWASLGHSETWVCMCAVLKPELLHVLMHVPLTIARPNRNPVAVPHSTFPGTCQHARMSNFRVAAPIRFILSWSKIYRAGVLNCLATWYAQASAHTRLFGIICIDHRFTPVS